MKRLQFWRLTAFLGLLLALLVPGRILAADGYRGEYQEGGSVKVIDESTGAEAAVLSVPGKTVNTEIAAAGGKIFFTAYTMSGYETANSLYSYSLKTGKTKLLCNLPENCFAYDCNEVYGGYLYLSGWNPSDNIMMFRCRTTGKGLKRIVAKAGYSRRYKNYIICTPTKVMGSFVRYTIYVYNTKTQKNKAAVKKAASYTLNGKRLYVAVMPKNGYPGDGATYRIVQYDLTTGAARVLVRSMKGYFITKITSKYVYMRTEGAYGDRTYYRYSIATGKRRKMTEAAYEKALR